MHASNVNNLDIYVKMIAEKEFPIESRETLASIDKTHELILLGLRRCEGVNIEAWASLIQLSVEDIVDAVSAIFGGTDTCLPFHFSRQNNLLTLQGNQLSLTQQGILLYNSVCENLFGVVNKGIK